MGVLQTLNNYYYILIFEGTSPEKAMKTAVFSVLLACFVASVYGSGCGLTSIQAQTDESIGFSDETKGYAWSVPGCCNNGDAAYNEALDQEIDGVLAVNLKLRAYKGYSKRMCALRCIEQVGGNQAPFPKESKACSRITWWMEDGDSYCRIHHGCLNANNKPTTHIVKKNYKGLTQVGDDEATMRGMEFYAVHRECLINGLNSADCKAKLTNNKNAAGTCQDAF